MSENLSLTEGRNPATAEIDTLPTLELVQAINAEDQIVPLAVAKVLPQIAQAVDLIVAAIEQGGRLFYFGAGTSGRLGVLDASECPPTFSTPPELVQGIIAGGDYALRHPIEAAEDQPEKGAADVHERGVGSKDVVVGIAASGRTPYVVGALNAARQAGAATVALVCSLPSTVADAADVVIAPLVGAEVVTGSTRMKAGTAQKLVLNTLSTASMIRLGKVYGNLMVDVQPTNEKLRQRARRIVSQAAGVDESVAAGLLLQSGGRVKTAVVMALLGCDLAEAEQRLIAAKDHIRQAITS